MNDIAEKLLNALQVEQLDRFLFRGHSPFDHLARVYGGHVIAQAMNAGARTVEPGRKLHSFHSYFLREGNPRIPLIFEVDPIRDGNSFNTRRVVVKQDGAAIYSCSLSFMKPADSFSHQEPMKPTAGPEGLESDDEFNARMVAKYPEKYAPFNIIYEGWELRRLKNFDPFEAEISPAERQVWMRYHLPVGDDPLLNQTLLAYISDMGLLATAFHPHGLTYYNNRVKASSLDHSMWFHAPFCVNDWVLYTSESHWAGEGRALNTGKLYSRDGVLVATAVQEGVLRALSK